MDDRSNVLLRARGQTPGAFSRIAAASFVSAVLTLAGLLAGPWLQPAAWLFLCFAPAIVLGHLARRKFRRSPGKFRNESMATFGLCVGYLGLFLSAFVIAAMLALGRV
jgi:hypothetical protein